MPSASEPSNSRIEKTVLIQASPAIVFQALTDARDLVRWFCDRATSDPREGGEFVAQWKSGKTSTRGRAVYTRLVPSSLVEMRWLEEGGGPIEDARHTFRYTIKFRHGTTEVGMQDEDGQALDQEAHETLSEGWNYVLQDLKDYCERRERAGKPRHAEDE
jgi:uncharacterized protein YndB with AHSA1/START domain